MRDSKTGLGIRAWTFLVIFLLSVSAPLCAVETAGLTIARIEGAGWQATNIRLLLALGGLQPSLTAEIGVLRLDMLETPIEGAQLKCPQLRLTTTSATCPDLRLVAKLPHLGSQQVRGTGRYSWAADQLDVELGGFKLADGAVTARVRMGPDGWQMTARGEALSIAGILALWPASTGAAPVTGEGTLALNVVAQGTGSAITSLTLRAQARDATVSNASGTLGSAALGASLSLSGEPLQAGWGGSLELTQTQGQLYLEPVFLDLTEQPASVTAQWVLRDAGTLALSELLYTQPGVVKVEGNLRLALRPALAPLGAELDLTGDGAAYALYLRPWWFGTPAETLNMSGPVSGSVQVTDGELSSIRLVPAGLSISDSTGRVEVADLVGQMSWADRGGSEPSELSWQAAQVYGLPISTGRVDFRVEGSSLELPEGLALGTLGGQLIIDELALSGLGTETPDARFAARISAIDLGQLTAALKWPSFQGTLSGVLPRLTYRNGEAVVGGTLRAQAFDGDFTLANLRVTGPFGDLPQLFGDLTASRVDLEQLTRTVSFGRITGRADLEISQLHLLAWSPVAFSARLATTPGDTSKHRISQQAIDNITAVSGGPTGMLSTGFMSMFEEFGYAELGLQCRLENGVCRMGGVGPARDGYYIVRGKGLPRIDVVGFKTEVDWARLVKQLQAIRTSREAVVE